MSSQYWSKTIIAISTVNAVSSVTSVTFNGISMYIIRKSSSLHKPTFVLLFALALTDFFTGFLVQPFFTWRMADKLGINYFKTSAPVWLRSLESTLRATSITVTVLLLTAVSFDRYLALHMMTRYRLIVTVKRTIVASILLSVAGTAVVVVVSVTKVNKSYGFLLLIFLPICLLFALVLFIVNSTKLVKQQNIVANHRSNGQPNSTGNQAQEMRVDIARYSKILTSLKYVFAAYIISYLPVVVGAIVGPTLEKGNLIGPVVSTISLINSAVNPFLYYWKIPSMRSEFKRVFNL